MYRSITIINEQITIIEDRGSKLMISSDATTLGSQGLPTDCWFSVGRVEILSVQFRAVAFSASLDKNYRYKLVTFQILQDTGLTPIEYHIKKFLPRLA